MILTPDFAHFVNEAANYVKENEKKNDRIAITQRYYGSWYSFRVHLLEGLYTSLKSDVRTDYDLESRIEFYKFVRTNDKRRGCNMIKTFPELENFYHMTEKLHDNRYGKFK